MGYEPHETKTVTVKAESGMDVTLVLPTSVQTEARAKYLRGLWDEHVKHLDGHWKGRVEASVPNELAEDMAEAMEFLGAIVASTEESGGETTLKSNGYWANGF